METLTSTLIADYESQLHAHHFAGVCLPLNDAPFEGRLTLRWLGEVLVAEVVSSAHVLEMAERNAAVAGALFFTVMIEGTAVLGQAGRWLRLRGGDAALSLPSEPFTIVCPDPIHLLTLQIPRDGALAGQIGDLTQPLLVPAQPGAARFDQIGLSGVLSRWLGRTGSTSGDPQEARILSLLQGVMQAGPGASGRGSYLAALAFIAERLHDPALSVGQVAGALGVTPRQVARIFAANGTTVGQEIAERRLQAARAALIDPTLAHLSVSEIGFRCGYSRAEVFSRRFRQRFGVAPGQMRRSGR